MAKSKVKKYYAVAVGKKPGIYDTWEECRNQVYCCPAKYKSFLKLEEAQAFMNKYETNRKKVESSPQPSAKEKNIIVPEPCVSSSDSHKEESKSYVLTKDQQIALDKMKNGDSIFLTGDAGTGKSTVIDEFISWAIDSNKKILVCAPTGIAAINIGGTTIHRAFKAKTQMITPADLQSCKPTKEVVAANIIVIDEISMCRVDLFDYMAHCIGKAEFESNAKKQIICVGDFFQLPPVIKDEEKDLYEDSWGRPMGEGFAFSSQYWNQLGLERVVLNEVVRQRGDNNFINRLNSIRIGDMRSVAWFNRHASRIKDKNAITICATNKKAQEINDTELNKLPGQQIVSEASKTGTITLGDVPADQKFVFKIGARVISLVNDTDDKYQNGSLGYIVDIVKIKGNNYIRVKFDNGNEEDISLYTWKSYVYELKVINGVESLERATIGTFEQFPLKLAYAITIHKSQGATFDSVNIMPFCFSVGQLYVALSRCRSISGLHLCYNISDNYLKTSDAVLNFYGISTDLQPNEDIIEDLRIPDFSIIENMSFNCETIDMKIPIVAKDDVIRLIRKYAVNT